MIDPTQPPTPEPEPTDEHEWTAEEILEREG